MKAIFSGALARCLPAIALLPAIKHIYQNVGVV